MRRERSKAVSAGKRAIDPIARFMQEHHTTLLHLASLNKASQSLAEDGFSPETFQRIVRALAFMQEEVTVHNKSEEEALFPVLERYVEGPTKIMREEHRTMRRDVGRLAKAIKFVEQHQDDPAAAQEVAVTARSVVQLMVNHIHKENHILFPLVQKFLTKDALREVARRLL